MRGLLRLLIAPAAAISCITAFADTPASAQSIEVGSPAEGSTTRAPPVRLVGFPPGSLIEVSFTRTAPDKQPPAFRSTARYRVGSDGTVDVSSVPISGDWTLLSPEAPYWTMRPDESAPLLDPDIVRIEARAGAISRTADFRISTLGGLKLDAVPQFAGAFLVYPADARGPLPLVIILGGSGGNDHTARHVAPLFAAEGYAALGLPYISPDRGTGQAIPGLPGTFSEIPVDRLQEVRRWATTDPRIDDERIGLWGESKGGEFAILAAAHFQWLDAVAAIVPSDVVWEGFSYTSSAGTGAPSFTLDRRPLPFVAYSAPGRGRDVKEAGRRADPARAAAARIPIERFAGPLLVAGGEQDRSWDSAGMSQAIAERRVEAGRETIALIFPDAGHDLGPPSLHPIEPVPGGSAEAIGAAQFRVWRATLGMFETALKGKMGASAQTGSRPIPDR